MGRWLGPPKALQPLLPLLLTLPNSSDYPGTTRRSRRAVIELTVDTVVDARIGRGIVVVEPIPPRLARPDPHLLTDDPSTIDPILDPGLARLQEQWLLLAPVGVMTKVR